MSQTERILFIDRQLRSVGTVTVKETAEHFEVSTRQVKRDIEYLRDRFSAPIVWDSESRVYRYEHQFRDLEFADQRLVMSYVILKSMSENNQYVPVYSDGMMTSIASDVPSDYRSVCDHITYQIPQAETINPDFFIDICAALRDKKCLVINYQSLSGEVTERCIEPEHLLNYSGNWYLICFDRLRSDLRTFHISRIKTLHLSSEKYTEHPCSYKDEVASFISNSFGIFKGTKTTKAVIHFYDTAARLIQNQCWHPKQKLTVSTDLQSHDVAQSTNSSVQERAYTQLEFPVANLTEVLYKILSFGSNARPVEPPELCELWRTEIEKLTSLSTEASH